MKRLFMSIVTLAAIAVVGVSCLQLEQPGMVDSPFGDEIVFEVQADITAQTKAAEVTQSFGDGIMVTTSSTPMPDPFVADGTKATAVTSLSSFYVSATNGSTSSETNVWSSVQFTQVAGSSPAVYKGSKVWPTSNPSYRFYASNVPLTYDQGGARVSATNATDVVVAYLAVSNVTYKAKNTLTFKHIFARIGTVTVTAESPFTITNVNITITPVTGGTYRLFYDDWFSTTQGSATTIASAAGANNNDLYLKPGTYQLTASWTATNGSYTENFSNKTVNITLVEGKVNNITCTLSGNNVNQPIGVYTVNASGKTVGFAPGNLQCTISGGPDATGYNWTGSNWCFAENQWDYLGDTDGNNAYVIGAKKDLFCRVATGGSYNSYGLCSLGYSYYSNSKFYGSGGTIRTDWGSISGVQTNCGYGWTTPTESEMSYIIMTRTTGITLNGTDNAKFTFATIRTDAAEVKGLILIPDNYSAGTPSGVTWGTINRRSDFTTQCTVAGWEVLEEAGCVFLPAAGYQSGATNIYSIQEAGNYWIGNFTTSLSGVWSWYLAFNPADSHIDGGSVNSLSQGYNSSGYSVRLIKQVNL